MLERGKFWHVDGHGFLHRPPPQVLQCVTRINTSTRGQRILTKDRLAVLSYNRRVRTWPHLMNDSLGPHETADSTPNGISIGSVVFLQSPRTRCGLKRQRPIGLHRCACTSEQDLCRLIRNFWFRVTFLEVNTLAIFSNYKDHAYFARYLCDSVVLSTY